MSRDDTHVAGYGLLARLGKRVLRPGGAELTETLLARAELTGSDVVELAIGRARTTREILDRHPHSYVGIDNDPDAIAAARRALPRQGSFLVTDAASTGLPDACADVVIGEAMLTMQGDHAKHAIVAEAARMLRPQGRYAIHELALTPDTIDDATKTTIRKALARSLRVNARPLTIVEWQALLARHGLVIDHVDAAPMALLQPRRVLADEGVAGTARFARNLLTHPDARRRVLAMRRTFRTHHTNLTAVAIVAHKAEPKTS
ncbi:class I SAM-dependent methyltransferase [Actinoplanes sp. TBRC 11911]|uniref:class I SAM-dependent methyltransferase n=1 Tax=Actinoplanes sp. TBRC 11911 TaxID=2729386 RepID=UPI00145CA04C|nr:class I SAM-dependent methyltransferase [Actinoplanes sp. TBRC 11911]NMO52830.1 class I SAM-dependent methyltransferase [Actinoplanes sp. TBRC 11911]